MKTIYLAMVLGVVGLTGCRGKQEMPPVEARGPLCPMDHSCAATEGKFYIVYDNAGKPHYYPARDYPDALPDPDAKPITHEPKDCCVDGTCPQGNTGPAIASGGSVAISGNCNSNITAQ